jgi:glycosyl transferase family 25
VKILIINTKLAQARRQFQADQMKKLGLEYSLLTAISVNDLDEKIYRQHRYDWQRPLKNSEVACYYSHRKAWQTVVQAKEPMLILEDDALLAKTTPLVLQDLQGAHNIDLVNFEVRGRKKHIGKIYKKIGSAHWLIRLYQDRAGAAAYILWPSGARKLLDLERRKGIALADARIATCYSLTAYQIEPAAAIQLDDCEAYDVPSPAEMKLSSSSVSSNIRENKEVIHTLKRVAHQAFLLARHIFLFSIAKRRFIDFKKDLFE